MPRRARKERVIPMCDKQYYIIPAYREGGDRYVVKSRAAPDDIAEGLFDTKKQAVAFVESVTGRRYVEPPEKKASKKERAAFRRFIQRGY